MPAILAAALGIFVATNIDDLVVLTALFGSGDVDARAIVVGQYAGIGVLVGVSAVAAVGLLVVPDHRIGLLGVVPLALGVRGLLQARRDGSAVVTTMGGVIAITLANGADNVGVYTPLFREAGWGTLAYVAVFFVLTGAWIALGAFLASRRPVVAVLARWGRGIVPLVYVGVGIVLIASAVGS